MASSDTDKMEEIVESTVTDQMEKIVESTDNDKMKETVASTDTDKKEEIVASTDTDIGPNDKIQFSSNEDEISLGDNMEGSDMIDPVYSNSNQAEDHDPVMSGAYAYVRDGLPNIIHWTMLSDGSFQFSPEQVITSDQYEVLSKYYYQDYNQHDYSQYDYNQYDYNQY